MELEMAPATTSPVDVTFDVRRAPGGTASVQVLEVSGDFDVEFADVVTSCAEPALSSSLLVVDLSRVRFLDCAALGTLVELKQRVRGHGGALLVRDPSPAAHQVLDVFGLDLALDAAHDPAHDPAPDGEGTGRRRGRAPAPIPG